MLSTIITVSILYFIVLGVASVVAWQFNAKMGVKLFKKGTAIYVSIAKLIAIYCVKVSVRIARFTWNQINRFVLPHVKKMMEFIKQNKITQGAK